MSTLVKDWEVTNKGLLVHLHNGTSYVFPEATADHAEGLAKAESKGKYFNEVLRPMKAEKAK